MRRVNFADEFLADKKVDLVAVVYPAYDKFPKDADEAIIASADIGT